MNQDVAPGMKSENRYECLVKICENPIKTLISLYRNEICGKYSRAGLITSTKTLLQKNKSLSQIWNKFFLTDMKELYPERCKKLKKLV